MRERVAKRRNQLGRVFDSNWARRWDRVGTSLVILIGTLGIARGIYGLLVGV